MHSSTPDLEHQSLLLSDNQTSSKVLALLQHGGCLSKKMTAIYFMILQSQICRYQSLLDCFWANSAYASDFYRVTFRKIYYFLNQRCMDSTTPKYNSLKQSKKQKKHANNTSCILMWSYFKKSVSCSLGCHFCLTLHVQF